MRQRDFDYGSGERRDERAFGGDRGRRDRSSGEETWYREGRWELPADQDVGWSRRAVSERSTEEGPFAGRGPRGYRRSDQAIFEEVCERLTAHGYIDATEIDVDVREGVVTLIGTAPDRRQKRLAEETIENVAGVQDVQNELRLAGRGAAEAAGRAKEESAAAAVRKQESAAAAVRKQELAAAGAGKMEAATREERGREQPIQTAARDEREEVAQTARKEEPRKEEPRKEEALKEEALKEEAGREETRRRQEQAAESERFQPVGSAGGGSPFDRSRAEERQTAEDQKTDAGFARREERQPVGVMERDADRQAEMMAPRSAGATDRPIGTAPERSGEMPGTPTGEMPGTPTGEMPGTRIGEITRPERSSDLDATRVQPATREVRLQAGAPVYSREGEKIGEVAEGGGDFFVVHKGLVFASELYFPAASILRSDENGVQLSVSKDDVANYKERPTPAPAR